MQTIPDDDSDRTEELDETLFPSPSDRPLPGPPTAALVREGVVLRERYLLGAPIAHTGQSIVFAAYDLRRDQDDSDFRDLAIKVLTEPRRQMPYAIARLKREFRQTQSLRHPGVVRMYDLDRELETWFITMERLEGESLRRRLEHDGDRPLNTADALRIAFACADVLEYAHDQGTPHGDFKPGNVFLVAGGSVRVLDFGTAPDIFAESSAVLADEGQIPRAATRAYAGPEVLDGEPAESRDDIFSFACVVYEMLAGRHPFDRLPANRARDEGRAVEPIAQLTPEQNAELRRGLAWKREDRPASVAGYLQSVLKPPKLATAAELAAAAAPIRLPPPPQAPTRWGVWFGGAAVVALLGWWGFDAAQHAHVLDAAAPPGAPAAEALATDAASAEALTQSRNPLPVIDGTAPATADPSASEVEEKPPAPVPKKPKGNLRVDSVAVFATEGAPSTVIVLQRDGDLGTPVEVSWKILDGSAHADQDFSGPVKGIVKFRAGQTSRALYIPLVDDADPEVQEFFTVALVSRSVQVGPNSQITITIDDND